MKKEAIEVLTSPVKVYYKPGPGSMKYKYVKGEDVIARLNTAFEHEWSSTVEHVYEKGNQIIVLISLHAGGVIHQGFGGAEIALHTKGPKQGQPVDISNNYKAAFTNALKKAAEQFGIGLEAEDAVELPEASPAAPEAPVVPSPAPTPTGSPIPPGWPAEASQPVSGSTVITNAPSESSAAVSATDDPMAQLASMMGNMDMSKVQAELSKLAAAQASGVPAPEAPKQSLAESFANSGYDPNEARQPEKASPFTPSGNGEEKINDIQLNALGGLAKMKKVTPEQAIASALPGAGKTSFDQLTRNEAKDVIQSLNNLQG